jgi:hypothetical protein
MAGSDFVGLPSVEGNTIYVNRRQVCTIETDKIDDKNGGSRKVSFIRMQDGGRFQIDMKSAKLAKLLNYPCSGCGYRVHSQQIAAMNSCMDCGRRGECDIEPQWGESVRINCYRWLPFKPKVPEVSDDDVS